MENPLEESRSERKRKQRQRLHPSQNQIQAQWKADRQRYSQASQEMQGELRRQKKKVIGGEQTYKRERVAQRRQNEREGRR